MIISSSVANGPMGRPHRSTPGITVSRYLWASVSDLNPKLGVTMGVLGGKSIGGSGDGSIGHGSCGNRSIGTDGAYGAFGAAAVAVGDARVGVLLSVAIPPTLQHGDQ